MAARPATRVVRERPAETAQPRPAVRDLSRGPASFRIDWDVRPAFDFVFSLSGDAGATEDLPAADREWLAASKSAMPADVATKFQRPVRVRDLHPRRRHRGRQARRSGRRRTSSTAVDGHVVQGRDPRDARGTHDEPELSDLVDRALEGDDAALPAIAELMDDYKREARLEVLREPERATSDLLDVLNSGRRVHADRDRGSRTILERDYDAPGGRPRRRSRRSTSSSGRPAASAGCPSPGVRRVILAPVATSRGRTTS